MRLQKFSLLTAGILSLLLCGGANAGLIITPTFDATITSDANAATIEEGINAAIARAENAISNNVTVSITFHEVTTGLGGSSTSHYSLPYGTYVNALQNQQTLSASDVTAIASLGYVPGASNPVNGNANVNVQTALARTLRIANYVGSDGTISLNTSIMNLSRSGTQNPSFYDLQAVAAHEINEVLGIGGPGSALPTTNSSVGVLDLFRYSAPGNRSFAIGTGVNAYFSIDGGATNLVNFNQAGNGSDYADWASSATRHVQDAFGTPGAIIDLGATELTALDVIGYDLGAVPEPATTAVGLLCLGVGMHRRRRSAQ